MKAAATHLQRVKLSIDAVLRAVSEDSPVEMKLLQNIGTIQATATHADRLHVHVYLG